MRGAHGVVQVHLVGFGIIPADAGSTRFGCPLTSASKDHPRGCGEHLTMLRKSLAEYGSSPRMRGAPTCGPCPRPSPGIIPADAGSTWSACMRHPHPEDHPRGCGEHGDSIVSAYQPTGSSPRMRGAHAPGTGLGLRPGIIPADAGSTGAYPHPVQVAQDHPRGCGEHDSLICSTAVPKGSSPRMRGALGDVAQQLPGTGIIPADAGSTAIDRIYHD